MTTTNEKKLAVAHAIEALPDSLTRSEVCAVVMTILDVYGIEGEERALLLLALLKSSGASVIQLTDDDDEMEEAMREREGATVN